MRDRDTIDAELRLLAAVRRSIREQGGEPSSSQVDELLVDSYATARWTADRVGQSRTRCWRRQVEHKTCSVGIVAFRMPMRKGLTCANPF